MKVPKHVVQWNLLAEKHDLPAIGGFLAKQRAEQVAYYQTLTEDFWRDLDAALGRRGAWAKGRRFPHFEQVMDEAIAAKLFEGFYDGKPGEGQDDERERLIVRLISEGWQGAAVATTEGLEGPRGVELWKEVSTERLYKMLGHNGIEGEAQ